MTGMQRPRIRSTTILTVRRGDAVAMGGDGQVSLGDTVMKADARKVRPLADGRVLTGFAGSAADAIIVRCRTVGSHQQLEVEKQSEETCT